MARIDHGSSYDLIRNGVVLSELAGYGNGAFCARHGAGAALVMLGTYIIAPDKPAAYADDFFIVQGDRGYGGFLRDEIRAARQSRAAVGVSVAAVDISEAADFCAAAEAAGARFVAVCLHSTYDVFTSTGTSAALCLRRNHGHLSAWARAMIYSVKVPVIFKVGVHDTPDTVQAAGVITGAGECIIHIDCGSSEQGSPGLEALHEISRFSPFVIASGGIADEDSACRVLRAGAGSVGIGRAAICDPLLCGRLQNALRKNGSGE